MALRCPECGTRVSSKAALSGHYRRAGHLALASAWQPALPEHHPPRHAIVPVPRPEEVAGLRLPEPKRSAPLSERDRLLAQYYALRAMAVKLDAGVGTEQAEILFRRALAEYDALFDRVNTSKALPASAGEPAATSSGDDQPLPWWSLI